MSVKEAFSRARELLLAQRDGATGAWTGSLSSSALSTALAVTALEDGDDTDRLLARRGAQWLTDGINSDGGWGDTPQSPSNLSASLIARACIARHPECMGINGALAASGAWILAETGGLSVACVGDTLRRVYGDDKTFAAPILMYLAICSQRQDEWTDVPPLPFVLALLPGWCFRFLKLEVVSYALPALIAVGLCRHLRAAAAAGRGPWGRLLAGRLLARLLAIQPDHGGFLDAIPLTAFVVLALKQSGYGDCAAARRGIGFLRNAVRSDGSWPIDTNLRCWLTSLAARALAPELTLRPDEARVTAAWLLGAQHGRTHPYTGARPGGWAWTDLPGGVPDADDTAGALIALRLLADAAPVAPLLRSVWLGLNWLMTLQNRDGGVPTFCRGWGHLPFDRSCSDITAHALEALTLWRSAPQSAGSDLFDDPFRKRIDVAVSAMIAFLNKSRGVDGSWVPLWFGHQQSDKKTNPVIGTARVLASLQTLRSDGGAVGAERRRVDVMSADAIRFLLAAQRADGGWSAGSDSTVEETALAVAALSGAGDSCRSAVANGAAWLSDMLLNNEIAAAPIGLYFSVLWYDERLYPLIWSVSALRALSPERSQALCGGSCKTPR